MNAVCSLCEKSGPTVLCHEPKADRALCATCADEEGFEKCLVCEERYERQRMEEVENDPDLKWCCRVCLPEYAETCRVDERERRCPTRY